MSTTTDEIMVRKLPDGWQAYRKINGKIVVLDNFFEFEDEVDAID